ncbi:MAG TPA: LecA/PA-IL family lectin [Pyrinomonadaceae bacterium]|nr:LecA/PA-IL family lectin [Pyrinomonadaceae bacterium]
MLKPYRMIKLLVAASLLFVFSISALADTIRMKDGSVIKGKIVEFKDNQFIIAIGDDSRGRRRQINVYADEIESIVFDSVNPIPSTTSTAEIKPSTTQTPTSAVKGTSIPEKPAEAVKPPVTKPAAKGNFVVVSNSVKVLADNTANGWTNSGFVVRRGQRVRVSAKGNISLGTGRYAKPDGDGSYADKDKLMQQKSTGALIAVIGDDNDEFIFIGSSGEFIAQRDGTLFLGINESNLDDNSGAFDVTVEAEVDNPDSPQE